MFKVLLRFGGIVVCLVLLASCGQSSSNGKLKKVGLLVPETINDQVWGTMGYKGMLKIQSKFHVDVYYKEGIHSLASVERAIKEFNQKGVNLIFGHGNEFATYFNELANDYPHIHFVSFNGDADLPNTTSLNFEAYSMGFFGGMVAAHTTKTNKIGMIAAYKWQPEIAGFLKGASFENQDVNVKIEYVNGWDDDEKALQLLKHLLDADVDVVYPAGDGFNVPIIETLKEKGLYAIGYVSDQSDLGESTVLISTVQHVDLLYELVAEKFNHGKLSSGTLTFDFQDGVISMGEYSPLIDEKFQKRLNEYIDNYKKTGKLPNEYK